jgi:hypothetical protein
MFSLKKYKLNCYTNKNLFSLLVIYLLNDFHPGFNKFSLVSCMSAKRYFDYYQSVINLLMFIFTFNYKSFFFPFVIVIFNSTIKTLLPWDHRFHLLTFQTQSYIGNNLQWVILWNISPPTGPNFNATIC